MLATVATGKVKLKNRMLEDVDDDSAEEDFSGLDDYDLLDQLADHGGLDEDDDDDGGLDDIDLDDLSGHDGLDDLDLEGEDFASVPLHKIRLLHKAVDADGDNKTSLEELLKFSDNVHNETIKVIVPELLAMLDHIKDGKLSLEEILQDMVDDSSNLTPDEINSWKELETMKFKLADANGDGFLSVDEVDHMFYPETHEGVLKLGIEALIKKRDRDGDGKLNFIEFWGTVNETNATDNETDGLQNPQNHTESQSEMDKFKKLDLDGDGVINFTEFFGTTTETNATDNETDSLQNQQNHTQNQSEHDIFNKLDKDGDGLLDAQELVAWESGRFHAEETLMELLELADVNHDHHLTVEEIEEAKEKIQNINARFDLVQWIKHLEL